MKRSVLVFSMTALLVLGGLNIANAQEQPAPKKDTVNMDTQAKPTFYYAVEDDKATESKKGGSSVIIIIAAAVVIAGAAGFFLLKKKK
jgi:LPXTG-motif cell wall-anchored protein